jgi:4-amino-4-deoxy-L-arabinose transferase-like glycosyltransferase
MGQTILDRTSSRSSRFPSARSKWSVFLVLGLLVCAVSALIIFPRVNTTEFSGDEPGWISASLYYTSLMENRDFDWNKWFCQDCQSFGRLNLHAAEFLYGIPLKIEQPNGTPPYFGFYLVEHSYEQNQREGLIPPPALLHQARQIAAFFGVLCVLMIFAVGFWGYNPWVGLFAAGLLVTNSVYLKIATQVMTDVFYNVFLLAVYLTLIFFMKAHTRKAMLVYCGLAGLFTGVAGSVKITGLLIATGCFLGALAWRSWRERESIRQLALPLATFAVASLVIVFLLDPFFWPSYDQRVWQEGKAFAHDVSTKKVVLWHRVDLENAAFAYPELRNLTHPIEFPLLFFRWSHIMKRYVKNGWAEWNGPRLPVLHKTLFQHLVPLGWELKSSLYMNVVAVLLAALTFAGIYYLLRSAKTDSRYVVLLLALACNYGLIILFMSLNWDRYYLPTMIAVDLIVGIGAYELVKRYLPAQKVAL